MRNPEHTRTLIVDKARDLFNRQGYRATSLSDITKATGMTKGAIYGNFENKDAVARASFDSAIKLVTSELRTRIKSAPSAPLKLKAILNYYAEYIDHPPIEGGCPIINTSVEADDQHPRLRKRADETIALIKSSFKRIVERGIREQQLRPDIDVELYAHMFYASITGAILISRVEGNNKSYETIRRGLEAQINAITL